jgi:hypothetical protein
MSNFKLLAREIADDADNTGCEDCYVVSGHLIEKLKQMLEDDDAAMALGDGVATLTNQIHAAEKTD